MAEPARGIARPLQGWRAQALAVGACLSILAAAAGTRLPWPEQVPLWGWQKQLGNVQEALWSWQEAVDLYALFWSRGARPAPADVVLVPIDNRAAKGLFLPAAPTDFERCSDVRSEALPGYRNPDPPDVLTRWPRCLHARVLDALAPAQPDLVVVDISFRPRSDPGGVFADQDRQLAAAMRHVGKVVLVRKIRLERSAGGGVAQPIAGEIEAAALATAPFLLLGDQLQRADKFCTFMRDGALQWPCLPAVVVNAASSLGSRKLADIHLGADKRYFNFYGPPGAFQTLRYESLAGDARAKLPGPGSLRGKIVFLGFAEREIPESTEHFTTPFTTANSVKLSGVELAATAYANLRDGSAIEPAPPWLGALITLSIGLICTVLCISYGAVAAVLACVGCGFAYCVAAWVAFDRYAAWLPLAVPLAGGVVTTVAGVTARSIGIRKHLIKLIRELLPESQAMQVIEKMRHLSDLERSAPGLSINTDIEGYTPYAEKHSAEEVVREIGPYFTELRRIAEKKGVYTFDTAGDGMMATWDVRTSDPSLRTLACATALELAAVGEKFARRTPKERHPTRIGMDYGAVEFAFIGNAIRPVGAPPVNAKRLQELNKALGTRVLVSGEVMKGLDQFLFRELGSFLLHGKDKAMAVYELLGIKTEATPQQLELHEKFGAALEAYRKFGEALKGRRRRGDALEPAAAGNLRALFGKLAAKANDGPSRYYARLCAKGVFFGTDPIPVDEPPK